MLLPRISLPDFALFVTNLDVAVAGSMDGARARAAARRWHASPTDREREAMARLEEAIDTVRARLN